jgi:hypothetical protein
VARRRVKALGKGCCLEEEEEEAGVAAAAAALLLLLLMEAVETGKRNPAVCSTTSRARRTRRRAAWGGCRRMVVVVVVLGVWVGGGVELQAHGMMMRRIALAFVLGLLQTLARRPLVCSLFREKRKECVVNM